MGILIGRVPRFALLLGQNTKNNNTKNYNNNKNI